MAYWPPAYVLWRMRECMQHSFVDRLAAAMFETVMDNPAEIGDNDLRGYINANFTFA
jgi:hypothetical protein